MKKLLFLVTLLITSFITFAQEATSVEMATDLRTSGKIYVVIAVLVLIFAGIVIYLIRLDKKISKLENELKK